MNVPGTNPVWPLWSLQSYISFLTPLTVSLCGSKVLASSLKHFLCPAVSYVWTLKQCTLSLSKDEFIHYISLFLKHFWNKYFDNTKAEDLDTRLLISVLSSDIDLCDIWQVTYILNASVYLYETDFECKATGLRSSHIRQCDVLEYMMQYQSSHVWETIKSLLDCVYWNRHK